MELVNKLFNNNINTSRLVLLAWRYKISSLNIAWDQLNERLLNKSYIPPFPRLINIFVTNRCNLSCPMCLNADDRHSKAGNDFSPALFDSLLPELIQHKPFIYIVGGEPLICSSLPPILKLLLKTGLCTALTTNGVYLNKQLDNILESNLEFISISLDHFDASEHDSSKGVNGVFDKTVKGIRELVKHRKKNPGNIKINTVVLPNNYDVLPEMFEFVKTLGVDEWSIQHNSFITPMIIKKIQHYKKNTGIGNYYDGFTIDTEALFNNKQIATLQSGLKIIENKSSKSSLNVSIRPQCDDLTSYYNGKFPGNSSSCSFPNHSLNINETGKVFSCLGYELGDLNKTTSLKTIWTSAGTKTFQHKIMKEMPVAGCFRCCALNYKFN